MHKLTVSECEAAYFCTGNQVHQPSVLSNLDKCKFAQTILIPAKFFNVAQNSAYNLLMHVLKMFLLRIGLV